MNPFLRTLLLLLKAVGKLGYLVLSAVLNFVLVSTEVLVALFPSHEVKKDKEEK